MRPIKAGEITRLQSLQSAAMDDVCHVISVTLSSGTYGNTVETRAYVYSGTPCGIEFTNGKIIRRGETEFVEYDAILRIANDKVILMTDEIELIEKGVTVISGTFKPHSAPVVNSSVQKVLLQRTDV
jgi:hypothetical protein